MKPNYDTAQEKNDNTILFSKVVKAGKRIYYVDVKRDRREELYLSITESKRIKDGTDETRPVFEKHKIFLYREDLEKFTEAFSEAVDYTRANSPEPAPRERQPENKSEETESESLKFDIEF
ncbi:MAG TPA: DUF3276 family protein [Alloprevotella sp.]|nr:DUF3276 family protein [Alloprevotella sp.]